jgi:hypothetical protein
MKLSALVLVVLTAACAGAPSRSGSQPIQFKASRTGATFAPSATLLAGTRIDFEIRALPKNHFFLAQKCGPGCNTAKQVMRVDGRGLDLQAATLIIKEDGRYYFWIQQRTEAGEFGHISVSDVKTTPQGFEASFRDGTTIVGAVQIQ